MQALIKAKDITFQYPGSDEPAVKNISFDIPANQWTALIGHNGSGKSTLARLIDGLLDLQHGSIVIDGLSLNLQNLPAIRQKIGFVFQNPDNQFVGTTVGEDVAFGLENRQVPRSEMKERVADSLKSVGMLAFVDEQPANLSGGQKQRVALAGVLAMEPQIVILDEATSMLDPEGRHQIDQLLTKLQQERELTILAITHDPYEAALADNVIMINDGELVEQGTSDQVLSQPDKLAQCHLESPFVYRLKQSLIDQGIEVPANIDNNRRMVDWLCQQLSFPS